MTTASQLHAPTLVLNIGDAKITPQIRDGYLHSIGAVQVGNASLRNPATRFLPWFDTYRGDMFRRFRFEGVHKRGSQTVLSTTSLSDTDLPFREQRDSSGDICLRDVSWDAPPLEARFDIVFEPVAQTIGGIHFNGFKYWFEYESSQAQNPTQNPTQIHRIIDRQTWEIGGNLDDVTICLRNWLTPPRMRIDKSTVYSTVGLDKWAGLLPGNLWARWSLLPSFDMQYGQAGVMLGWFDRMSLIRTVVESAAGEDCLRVSDLHYFTQTHKVATNPKTIAWSDQQIDHTDALNLWTAMTDLEADKARAQFGLKEEEPPALIFYENKWVGFRFESSYEHVISVASEFGAEMVFIDPVWEHGQALLETINDLIPAEKRKGTIVEKNVPSNMCCTFDYEVARILGGEEGLKQLVDRARAKGIRLMSWMAAHYHPHTSLANDPKLGHGANSIFAAKESGRHPDTGYPGVCWSANLNAPVYDKIRTQILGVCERTGLAGFLWDSFSNLGWWQIDYSKGDMRPQFDRMVSLYTELSNAGLYMLPEALVTFSSHSGCGMHGGNVYTGDLLGYSYNCNVSLQYHSVENDHSSPVIDWTERIIKGEAPVAMLFQALAHKRVPSFSFHAVPRDQWNPQAVADIKELFKAYRKCKTLMRRRTVLKDGLGVRWDNDANQPLLFVFKDHAGNAVDVLSGEKSGGKLKTGRVYLL